jgi:hypothetical protein
MSSVNGAVPTTIIVAGLALAGYALLMTALNRRMSVPLLAALDVLEILLLVEVSLIVAKLASGQHPAGLATLIGYLIAMPLIPVAAAFWGLVERSRWDPAGHRRGRTRRGHTDGPAAPNLAGHPCLSPRHRLSPQHPLSRRRRARPGQDPAVCWSPPTDFALSASARAGVQITTKFGHAPVAYLLSAFAAVVYILAMVTLTVGSPVARRIAVLSCSIELVGVLAVGTWSLADPATFPDATVWSSYGSGYGFVPLVLSPFSACSGYAAGPGGPEPGRRS